MIKVTGDHTPAHIGDEVVGFFRFKTIGAEIVHMVPRIQMAGIFGIVGHQKLRPAVVVEVSNQRVNGAVTGNFQHIIGGVAVFAAPVDIGLIKTDGGAGEMVVQEHPQNPVRVSDQRAAPGIFSLKALGSIKIRIGKQQRIIGIKPVSAALAE